MFRTFEEYWLNIPSYRRAGFNKAMAEQIWDDQQKVIEDKDEEIESLRKEIGEIKSKVVTKKNISDVVLTRGLKIRVLPNVLSMGEHHALAMSNHWSYNKFNDTYVDHFDYNWKFITLSLFERSIDKLDPTFIYFRCKPSSEILEMSKKLVEKNNGQVFIFDEEV